jgi:hypothetical protein
MTVRTVWHIVGSNAVTYCSDTVLTVMSVRILVAHNVDINDDKDCSDTVLILMTVINAITQSAERNDGT